MSDNKLIELKSKYERVFGSPDGQTVLKDIINSARVYISSGDVEFVVMARDDGKRELALHIKDMATPKPEMKKSEVIT
jgi:hypothetical protein